MKCQSGFCHLIFLYSNGASCLRFQFLVEPGLLFFYALFGFHTVGGHRTSW